MARAEMPLLLEPIRWLRSFDAASRPQLLRLSDGSEWICKLANASGHDGIDLTAQGWLSICFVHSCRSTGFNNS